MKKERESESDYSDKTKSVCNRINNDPEFQKIHCEIDGNMFKLTRKSDGKTTYSNFMYLRQNALNFLD